MSETQVRSLADTVEIAPGVRMPRLGIGTYLAEGLAVEREIGWALEIGYRHIDTANAYGNERSIGEALRRSGVPRDEVFVTTKMNPSDTGYRSTLAACEQSIRDLGFDHVDLYLVHWWVPTRWRDTWRAMESLLASGKTRAIGVSNHMQHHLEQLLAYANVPPALDQFEFHPRLQQPELRRFCAEHGIAMEAWAPIMRGRVDDIPELVEIARRHGKTPVQVTLRWILQEGLVAIPKSVHRERLKENSDVYDFELSEDEMAVIGGLDRGQRIGEDPETRGDMRVIPRARRVLARLASRL